MTNSLTLPDERALTPAGKGAIIFILDRSGSMGGKQSDVIGGFNSCIETLRDNTDGNECSVTYWRFDERIEKVYQTPLADVPEMTARYYQPRGSTALLDAVGKAVSDVANDAGINYVVITFTDGYENASREWTKEKVSTLLNERKALGNWTFAFFGADIDAWADAGGMGFDAGNSMSHSSAYTKDMMRASGRVGAMMAKSKVRSSRRYAEATDAARVNPDITDKQLEELLNDPGTSDSER